MNLALILLVLSVVSGIVYMLDVIFWAKKREKGAKMPLLIEYSRSFFPIFFIVLFLRSFLVEPFRIPSGSLEPTLLVGDFVVVNKFAYGLRLPVWDKKFLPVAEPENGQIAVFRWPPDPSYDYIKRVIGVPGDKIEYENKVLTINGTKASQKFITYTTDTNGGITNWKVEKRQENLLGIVHDIFIRPDVPAFDFSITVPKGYYFMMGDNRDDSADSRYWGFVSEEYLRGKAFAVWMSWNGMTNSVRWSRIPRLIG